MTTPIDLFGLFGEGSRRTTSNTVVPSASCLSSTLPVGTLSGDASPRMDGYPADVQPRLRKVLLHDLLHGTFPIFVDEMHEQPGEDLPVAEYPLDERIPVRIVLPAQQIMPQGAEL